MKSVKPIQFCHTFFKLAKRLGLRQAFRMAKDPYNYGAIPQRRRELYFRVIDGYPNLHSITHRLHFLDQHFPPEKIDKALSWLVNNRVTGRKFCEWFSAECKNSDLEMHRRLLHIVDNAPLTRVIAGKNFTP